MIDKLDKLMHERKLNINSFSSQSGIPYMTVKNFYEKGTENVKLSTLKKIATFFDVPLDYIADDDFSEDMLESFNQIKKAPSAEDSTEEAIEKDAREIFDVLSESGLIQKTSPEKLDKAIRILTILLED